ncbi:MAG: PqqD family protein [Chloroflexi bacterium]|nr:PqqD family protein [Chloroflexota bacterium]
MNLTSYPVPHSQVAAQIVDDEAVIVLADAGEVTVLNPVGTRVWELIDGAHTVQQMVNVIADEFEVTPEQAREDVEEFLETLAQNKMVVFDDTPRHPS